MGAGQRSFWFAVRIGAVIVAAAALAPAGYAQGCRLKANAAQLGASGGSQVGSSVASSADGSVVAVSAPYTTVGSLDAGEVYIFTKSPGAKWSGSPTPTAVLSPPSPASGEDFGASVAISGDGKVVVVGAYGANSGQGTAYVFNEPTTGWANSSSPDATLAASDGAANDFFGFAVAISSDASAILVGAYNHTVNANPGQGAAYEFTEPPGGWTVSLSEAANLYDPSGAGSDRFGSSVGINGTTAVIGAPGVGSNTGAVYVFSGTTELQELADPGANQVDQFGVSVAISGDGSTIVAGSNPQENAAFVFTSPSGVWTQAATLTACGGGALGGPVAISSDASTIAASNPFAMLNGSSNAQGVAYQFAEPHKGWASESSSAEFGFSGAPQYSYLGASLAVGIAGSTAWVFAGSPGAGGGNNGVAYVFKK